MSQPLENAFKQFTLETSRLETVFQTLNDQFASIKHDLQETNTKLSGKINELDFVTHYLGAILQHISQGILFIDLSGTVTTYNRAAEEILDIPSEDVLYHPVWSRMADDAFGFSLRSAIGEKRSPKTSLTTWNVPGNSPRQLEVEPIFVQSEPHASPQSQAGNHCVQGLLLLIRNVTEIKRLQDISQRQDRLKDLGEMAARLAHEIRNPLGSIKGFAELLQSDLKGYPELKKLADFIVEGAEGLNKVVSNVLTYSRGVHPHFEQVELVSLIKDMLTQIRSDPHYHEGTTCRLNTSLKELTTQVDPSLIRSALLNLIVNALEAMPTGGNLEIGLQRDKEYAILTVRDTGVGIAPENIKKLFSPFFTTKHAGNGLGLSEVYKVIQAHNGDIEVVSKVGEGTLFKLKILLRGDYGH